MQLMERDAELELFDTLLADCATGSDHIVIVSGPAGVGKTELSRAFAEYAKENGARRLHVSGSRSEAGLRFGVLKQLIRGTARLDGRVRDESERLLGELKTIEHDRLEPVHERVVQELREAITRVAEQYPVVLTVDNVPHVDSLSLRCLLFLVRRLRPAGVLVVLNGLLRRNTAFSVFVSELTREFNCHQMRLSLLSQDGVARMLADHSTVPDNPQLVAEFHALSGGNPLLVRALIEDMAVEVKSERRQQVKGPVVRDAFRQALSACLESYEDTVARVAEVIAALGDLSATDLVGALFDGDGESIVQAVETLADIGLLDMGRFRHPAVPAAVLDRMSQEDRSNLRLRAAEMLFRDGAPEAVVARYLVAAGQVPAEWAVAPLKQAAEQVLGEDAAGAVEFLELALRFDSDPTERASMVASLAHAKARANPVNAARLYAELAVSFRKGLVPGRVGASLVRNLLWHGMVGEAGEALRWILSSRDELDQESVDRLELLSIRLSCWYPAVAAEFKTGLGRASGPTAVSGNPTRQAFTALHAVMTGTHHPASVEGVEHLLETTRPADDTMEAVVISLMTLIYADRLDVAARACTNLMRDSTARRDQFVHAWLFGMRAEIALRQGDLSLAERYGRMALTRVPREAWGVGIGAPIAATVLALTATGNHDEAGRLLRQPVPESMFQTPFGIHYLHARGRRHLAVNRVHAALDDFQACGELMAEWGVDRASIVAWRLDMAETYLRMRRYAEVRRLVDEQMERTDNSSRAYGVALRLMAATSRREGRPQLLEKSVETLRACGDRYELACSFADLSRAHHQLGDTDSSLKAVRRAWHLARLCNAEPLRRKLRSIHETEKPEVPAQRPVDEETMGALSAAERRVVTFVAQGHTNPEVAEKLYITVSTVEQHLTRAYRKLNVKGRADLFARFSMTARET